MRRSLQNAQSIETEAWESLVPGWRRVKSTGAAAIPSRYFPVARARPIATHGGMPKGFFSQGVCLLLSRPVTLDELEPLLADFGTPTRLEGAEAKEIAGPGFVIPYRPEVNGTVVIDLQDGRWPDHMGDPKNEAMLFGAWSMGHYAPYAYPGNLERAVQQAWTWKEASATVAQHQAFLRIKSTYVGGADGNAPVMPADYQAEPELEFVVKVAMALAQHPAVLAYFNPGGEIILPREAVQEQLDYHRQQKLPPLGVWSNVRMFNPNNGWLLMDTIGLDQLDIPDQEACFPKDDYDPSDVANLLRNISLYRLRQGDVIRHGDTMDGPGGVRWRGFKVEESLSPRGREVMRWLPQDGSNPPEAMRPPGEKPSGILSRLARLLGGS
jgi:hypothetical protein